MWFGVCLGVECWVLGVGVWGLEFGFYYLGFGVWGLEFGVDGFGSCVLGLGLGSMLGCSWFRIHGSRFRFCGSRWPQYLGLCRGFFVLRVEG